MYFNLNYSYNDDKVSEVITIGDIYYANEKNLTKKLNQFIGKKIYDIDLRLLKNEIEKDLWIKYAQVSIEKPTTLIIKVIEYDPIYLWNNKVYVDKEGSKINIDRYNMKRILKLNSNIGGHDEMYKVYLTTQEILSMINLNINAVERDLDTLKIFTQRYNFYVSFGMFERKLIEFVSIYDQFSSKSEKLKKVKNIDLRYPTGFAVE
tara:strand:- start:1 stop:618 length:618 start_codon:yes stop_codon:yes gene_type:complete